MKAWIIKAVKSVWTFVWKYIDMAISVFHQPGTTKISMKRVLAAFFVYSWVVNLYHITTLPGFTAITLLLLGLAVILMAVAAITNT